MLFRSVRGNRLESWNKQAAIAANKVVRDMGLERKGLVEETLDGKTHDVMFTPQIPATRSFGPLVVPPGRYFVMGDNRDNSNDSRYIGMIERRRIVGKATAVAFSLDRNHWYRPRLHRFFKGIK